MENAGLQKPTGNILCRYAEINGTTVGTAQTVPLIMTSAAEKHDTRQAKLGVDELSSPPNPHRIALWFRSRSSFSWRMASLLCEVVSRLRRNRQDGG
jgi:hypothetical protein